MIKYFEFDSVDNYGQHIVPINTVRDINLTKVATSNWAPELMKIITGMQRDPKYYYVVINALGSWEVWGSNRNGDGFPESGLRHRSLRSDMGTPNDYGYKTFEYYAKLYKHHVNKDPNRSFGNVVFSYWNDSLKRVELIVAIDREKAADIIEALEGDSLVSVSMGCLTDPDYPILTINGYVPINEIKVGDIVMTHAGNWKKVTEIHRRKYTGELYELNFKGLPLPLELTTDHPLMMKNFFKESKEKNRPYINPEEFEKVKFDWAHVSHAELSDHVQYLPVKYSESSFVKIEDERLARLAGYYVAEGSFSYNNGKPCTIQLSCHIDDDLPREVPSILEGIYPDVTYGIKPRSHSRSSIDLSIYSTELACFLEKYFGKKSCSKFIPPEIFVSDVNVKLAFIGAWLSGDGFCDKKGVHFSSCNINLILQLRDLLISCDIPSSIYKIVHKSGSGFNNHDTIEYTLNMSHFDAEQLIPYATRKLSNLNKIIDDRKKEGNSSIRKNLDNTYSYSIKSISKRYVENIQTYNFEVEDDESYIAAGLVSHNCKVRYDRCSICDNKAKTTKSYCKHLKEYMGKIVTEDLATKWSYELKKPILPGTMVFAWNDYPRFFDISKVYIGADRTSYILGKAASASTITPSAHVAEAYGVTDEMIDKLAIIGKSGDINKEVGSNSSDVDGKVTALKNKIDNVVSKSIDEEPPIPKDLLNVISTPSIPLSRILSTMIGVGIHPKPAEFQRMVLVNIGEPQLADYLDSQHMCFDHLSPVDNPVNLDISESNFNDIIAKALIPYLEKRSSFPSFLESRLSNTFEKYAGLTNSNDYWLESGPGTGSYIETSPLSPQMKAIGGLAAIYAGLKAKASGMTPKKIMSVFHAKPWLRSLIGGGVMLTIMNKLMSSREYDESLYRPASDYGNILQDTNFSGHMKMSSLTNAAGLGVLTGALAFPAAHVVNSYNRKSLYQKGKSLFPGAGSDPKKMAATSGGLAIAGTVGYDMLRKKLSRIK